VSRRLALFVLVGSLLLVIGSRSATSILATIMTLPILYWVSWTRTLRTGNDRLLAILGGAILIGLCGWLILDDTLIFELLGRSATLTGRTEVWSLSIWAAQMSPWFGQGHTFWGVPNPLRDEIWRMIGWAPPHAHHTLLDIWLQLGYVGVALLLVIVTIITLRGARLLLNGLPAPAMLWLVLFLQLVIRSQTETTIVDTAISGMFWLTAVYAAFAQLSHAPPHLAAPR
jgi:exopolysaccharide production protein ExoQ